MSKMNYIVLGIAIILLTYVGIVSAAPNGGSVTDINSSSSTLSSEPGNNSAYAGNVSELVIYGLSETQSWQGYYGNVSGAIKLADGNNFVMYNWSLTTLTGEVYASTNSSLQWTNIQCFNFTANGTYADDSAQAGGTSLYGTNVSQLETSFNFPASAADGVDETFTLIGAGTHDAFSVGPLSFSEGECRNTRMFDNTGAGVSNKFEEVLLYEPSTASVVFTSLLENDMGGFNSKTNDFEMLVLEDGHNADNNAKSYYFFVELQ